MFDQTRRRSVGVVAVAVLWMAVGIGCHHSKMQGHPAASSRGLLTDPLEVPGSQEFATTFAYGSFTLHTPEGEKTIRCEGIPGISGVAAAGRVGRTDGRASVDLQRLITHFHFDDPKIVIEQNPRRPSPGWLVGAHKGEAAALFPGTATFEQYIYLTLEGRVLANREPLVMSAEGVTSWPPLGSVFRSTGPTDFYDLDRLDDSEAPIVATLSACNVRVEGHIAYPAQAPAL